MDFMRLAVRRYETKGATASCYIGYLGNGMPCARLGATVALDTEYEVPSRPPSSHRQSSGGNVWIGDVKKPHGRHSPPRGVEMFVLSYTSGWHKTTTAVKP